MSLKHKRSCKGFTRILMASGSDDVENVAVKNYTMIHRYKSERYSQDCYSFLWRLFTFLGIVNYLCQYERLVYRGSINQNNVCEM